MCTINFIYLYFAYYTIYRSVYMILMKDERFIIEAEGSFRERI